MTQPGTLKRYLMILRFLQQTTHKRTSLRHLQRHLEEQGIALSTRTLQRDFEALETEFGIYIAYDRASNGYYIHLPADEDPDDFQQVIRLLELAERVETLTHTFQATREAAQFIAFERADAFTGSIHLSQLIEAIRTKKVIQFVYQAFDKDESKPYQLDPYLLAEYRNRWYVWGRDQQADKLKTFGLDRIQTLSVTDKSSRETKLRYKELLRHTFGITCLDQAPEHLVLSFTPQQGKYLKTLPLHSTQTILLDTPEEFRIALEVVINYEIQKEILRYGPDVEVLEPAHLRAAIQTKVEQTQKKYAG